MHILWETQLKTLQEEVVMVGADLTKSQHRAVVLDVDVARLAVENSKLKDEVRKINVDAEEARSNYVRN